MRKPAQNSKPSARKVPGKPFKKGQSGNPGGRPKEVAEVRELARTHTTLAIETLAAIAKSADRDAARVAAANSLLDRGWGRPLTEIEVKLALLKELESRTDDQLQRLAGIVTPQEPQSTPVANRAWTTEQHGCPNCALLVKELPHGAKCTKCGTFCP